MKRDEAAAKLESLFYEMTCGAKLEKAIEIARETREALEAFVDGGSPPDLSADTRGRDLAEERDTLKAAIDGWRERAARDDGEIRRLKKERDVLKARVAGLEKERSRAQALSEQDLARATTWQQYASRLEQAASDLAQWFDSDNDKVSGWALMMRLHNAMTTGPGGDGGALERLLVHELDSPEPGIAKTDRTPGEVEAGREALAMAATELDRREPADSEE